MGKINVLSNYRIKRFCQLLDTHQYRLLCNKKLLSLPIIGYSNFILFQFLVFCPPLMIFDIQSGGILEFFFFFLRAGEGGRGQPTTLTFATPPRTTLLHICNLPRGWGAREGWDQKVFFFGYFLRTFQLAVQDSLAHLCNQSSCAFCRP